jgi:hypothetical protein
MEIRLGNTYPAGSLSNLAAHGFTFRGIECGSMEGLLQGVKFQATEMQTHVCTLAGHKARLAGKNKKWYATQTLWWQGEAMKRDSDEYQTFLDEAYESLFKQNEKAQNALLATKDATLKHSMGKRKINETVLTQKEFCSRLTYMRTLIQSENFLDF